MGRGTVMFSTKNYHFLELEVVIFHSASWGNLNWVSRQAFGFWYRYFPFSLLCDSFYLE